MRKPFIERIVINKWPDIDMRIDDQGILNEILIANPDWKSVLHYESQSLLNSMHASFLRHHLRAQTPDFEQRIG
jgi:hypothetical protein